MIYHNITKNANGQLFFLTRKTAKNKLKNSALFRKYSTLFFNG